MSTPTDAPAKKGKPWLAPLLAAILAGGGAGGYFYFQGQADAAVPGEEAEEPIEYGSFMEMDGLVVNPKDTSGRRFFMVKVGIEAESEDAVKTFESRGPVAKDVLLRFFSAMTVDQLGAVSQRDSIKEDLRAQLNKIMGEDGEITRVYFTQYVLQ